MRLNARQLLVGSLCTASVAFAAHAGGGIVINEIRTDQFSTDNQEYFELKGPASASLDGLTYIVIGDGAGASGVIESVTDLTGFSIAVDGLFLVAESTFNDAPDPYGLVADLTATLDFENSDNVTHMLVSGFTGADNDDLDTDDDGVLDVTPWSAIVDVIAIIEEANPPVDTEFHYGGANTIGPEAGTLAPGHVYRCEVAGTWTIGRFDLLDTPSAIDTPGDTNASCTLTPGTCGDVGAGSCFVGNGTMTPSPACDDLDCCNTVCALDTFCCDVDWDGFCAQTANINCAGGDPCGLPLAGGCFTANGTLGCDDASCCNTVCTIDPDCCNIGWDQACVDLALANCLPPPGDWIINEIHADPAPTAPGGDANNDGTRDATEDEFVEIYNNSGAAGDISGWSLSDGVSVRHVFPNGTIIPDQCVVVVFGGGVPTGVFGNATVQIASTSALGLNNSGDTVTLTDDLAVVQVEVTYGSGGIPSGTDESITRDPDVTGFFIGHSSAGTPDIGTAWSPGTMFDGSNFPGCAMVPDMDMDGIADGVDNCPTIPNPFQEDCDDDGQGDACEDDLNANMVPDDCEITPPTGLVINEIRIDQPGGDPDEYFELRSDTPSQSLEQLTYLVIGDGAGGSGTIEEVVDLNGESTDGSGFFVVAEATFSLGVANLTEDLNFENGDNVTHMLVANFFGSVGDDIDADDDGIIDNTLWLAVVDDVALIRDDDLSGDDDGKGGVDPENDEHFYSTNIVGPEMFPGFNATPGHAYRCSPDDTWTIGLFDPFDVMDPPTDTPGTGNIACGVGGCLGDITDSAGIAPDGEVNVFDLLALLAAWGPCPGCPEDITDSAGAAPDGVVDVFDLLALLAAWGSCP